MKNQEATAIFESLSSGVRLDIYRLLVKKGAEGLVAGEIATALDLPPTNLSFHFRAMTGRFVDRRTGRALPTLPSQYSSDAGSDRIPDGGVLCRSSGSLCRTAGSLVLLSCAVATTVGCPMSGSAITVFCTLDIRASN